MNNRESGRIGEEIAEKFLENNGIKIINKNFFTKYGEIDLIGFENRTIIFIEVKLRNSNKFGEPAEAVNDLKLKRIYNAAEEFLSETEIVFTDCRFDVILITKEISNYKIEWLKNQNFN